MKSHLSISYIQRATPSHIPSHIHHQNKTHSLLNNHSHTLRLSAPTPTNDGLHCPQILHWTPPAHGRETPPHDLLNQTQLLKPQKAHSRGFEI
jgi:hypothetical protein